MALNAACIVVAPGMSPHHAVAGWTVLLRKTGFRASLLVTMDPLVEAIPHLPHCEGAGETVVQVRTALKMAMGTATDAAVDWCPAASRCLLYLSLLLAGFCPLDAFPSFSASASLTLGRLKGQLRAPNHVRRSPQLTPDTR